MLAFDASEVLEFRDLIPTGKVLPCNEFRSFRQIGPAELDHAFILDFSKEQPICLLRDPESGLQLEIRADRRYRYLQIYTPAHRKSIALETISAAPDSFNNKMGLEILKAGEGISFHVEYGISNFHNESI
jgi:aldose 1-epimerase